MTADDALESDKGIGLAIVLAALAIGAAVVTLVTPGTVTGAWGFAAAMAFGALAVVAVHVYG